MQKASYFEFENLYSPRNASSLWKPEGKMHVIRPRITDFGLSTKRAVKGRWARACGSKILHQ